MQKVYAHEGGSILVWIFLIGAVVLWIMFSLVGDSSDPLVETQNDPNSNIESADVVNETQITKSFRPVNDYDTARGKIVLTEDEFGRYSFIASLALPSEFPGTSYYAKVIDLEGGTEELGRLSKTGGSFYFEYYLPLDIERYGQAVVYVDGEAATVEGKTLPHNVMVVDL